MPTLAELRAARRGRVKARKRTGPRPASPRTPEARYERALRGLNRALVREVDRTIQPYLNAARRAESAAASEREDAEINTGLFGTDFGTLRIRLGRMVREAAVSPIVDQFGREIVKWNTREMRRILSVDLADETPALRAILAQIRRDNVALITSIADRLLDDVFRTVTESVIHGTRVETLAREIRERYSVSDSRARLIARDQTLKANASLTQERHKEAGVSRYVWSSSRDERVRPIHALLDGFVFDWSDPPITAEDGSTNHPGEDYQCRCIAIPVLDD